MNNKTTPKDFFLHVAATIFLYAAVIALMNLAFEVANRVLPDALQSFYGAGSLVWPISMLIVLVPVTYVIEWLISRDIVKMPEKKDIWIRRWRMYLTLFLTAISIIVDLIVLINTYLNGEISSRFVYKVLIVLIVSAIVFAYYILAKNAAPGRSKMWRMTLSWLGIIVVVGSIVAGFIIVGSPATQRSMRFDEQRVNDLNSIQQEIISYWQRKGNVPSTLSDLNNSITGFTVPVDPENASVGQLAVMREYEYTPAGTNMFELCATFDLLSNASNPSVNYPRPYSMSDNWSHGAGHVCFSRTIDPSLFPSVPKTQ